MHTVDYAVFLQADMFVVRNTGDTNGLFSTKDHQWIGIFFTDDLPTTGNVTQAHVAHLFIPLTLFIPKAPACCVDSQPGTPLTLL